MSVLAYAKNNALPICKQFQFKYPETYNLVREFYFQKRVFVKDNGDIKVSGHFGGFATIDELFKKSKASQEFKTIQEALYCFSKDLTEKPSCPICGKDCRFGNDGIFHYFKTCGTHSCIQALKVRNHNLKLSKPKEKKEDLRIFDTKRFIEKALEVHPTGYSFEKTKYVNNKTPVIITCNKHGDFTMKPRRFLEQSICPKCSKTVSLSELEIKAWLEKHRIPFVSQKTFPGLKDKALLRFDFYIPTENLVIEFQGYQHFEIPSWGRSNLEKAKRDLALTQKHDEIKRTFCKENNLEELEIYYKDYDKLDEILSQKLLRGKANA